MTTKKGYPLPTKGRLFSWKVGFLPQPQQTKDYSHKKRRHNSRAGNNRVDLTTKNEKKV